jgi:hypothetical protein
MKNQYSKLIKFFKIFLCSTLFSFLINNLLYAQSVSLQGQLSGWFLINNNQETNTQLGIRYLPSMFFSNQLSQDYYLDFECSIKTYAVGYYDSFDLIESNKDFKPYRIWARFSSSQFELRAGLQKISFGSATIFRPLMWFDLIDPRDPLRITDGVYGLLFRYYVLNNTNIWLWGLYGNEDLKGWEFYPTVKNKPEFGGRIQFPLFNGEAAFSFHHRQIDLSNLFFIPGLSVNNIVPENRYAFDGKWDVGVGFWLEGVVNHHKSDLLPYEWQRTINVGFDYTFDIGNGLGLINEHFILENTKNIFESGEGFKFSALSINYPLSILDNIGTILYYDWKNEEFYRFLSWQRNYDNWSIYMFGFWNPDEYKIYSSAQESTQFSSKGIQIMIVFNH